MSGVHQVLTQRRQTKHFNAKITTSRGKHQQTLDAMFDNPTIFSQISDNKARFMVGDFLHRDCDVLADDKL